MSVSYAKNASSSKICSSTTLSRLRTLRHIWPAEMAADFITSLDADIVQAYTGPAGRETTSLVDSIELEVPANMIGDFDLITSLRAQVPLVAPAVAVLPGVLPSAYLASPFVIRIRKVYVTTTGGVHLDTDFTSLSILVPRSSYTPTLNSGAATFPNYIVSSFSHNLVLAAGRYVIDLLLEQDKEFWSGTNQPGGWTVSGYAATPVGFTAYAGVNDPTDAADRPQMFILRPNFMFKKSTKGSSTFAPLATAQKTYLCTDGMCTESTAVGAGALDTCLSTCV
jgi:hypothetical protein